MSFEHIAVVGAGAWGTALANAIARAGRTVTLCARDAASAAAIAARRESPRLPGTRLDERACASWRRARTGRHDAILLAVPSQHLRRRGVMIAPALAPGTPVIACAKGIERGTRKFMTEVIAESAPSARCRRSCPARASPPTWRAACRPR